MAVNSVTDDMPRRSSLPSSPREWLSGFPVPSIYQWRLNIGSFHSEVLCGCRGCLFRPVGRCRFPYPRASWQSRQFQVHAFTILFNSGLMPPVSFHILRSTANTTLHGASHLMPVSPSVTLASVALDCGRFARAQASLGAIIARYGVSPRGRDGLARPRQRFDSHWSNFMWAPSRLNISNSILSEAFGPVLISPIISDLGGKSCSNVDSPALSCWRGQPVESAT